MASDRVTANLYVKSHEPDVGDLWLPVLDVPIADFERFTFRPLKWLRFAIFAICGARGHLSLTPKGPPVDYERFDMSNLGELAREYYYLRDDVNADYKMVDYDVLNDRISSPVRTARVKSFRKDLLQREDGKCAVSESSLLLHACHLIPFSKGPQYVDAVVENRQGLYPEDAGLSDIELNSEKNGFLLTCHHRNEFGSGYFAFLKTPNFALEMHDIPIFEDPTSEHFRITRQTFVLDNTTLTKLLQADRDVHTKYPERLPPALILDYTFGAAVFGKYNARRGFDKWLQVVSKADYRNLAPPPDKDPSTPSEDSEDSDTSQDDPSYGPPARKKARVHDVTSPNMHSALDNMAILSMLTNGVSFRKLDEARSKAAVEAELKEQQAGVEKVQEWLQH